MLSYRKLVVLGDPFPGRSSRLHILWATWRRFRSHRFRIDARFGQFYRSRTHLVLNKDSPEPRPVQPPGIGLVVALPQVGGLDHRYQRRAA